MSPAELLIVASSGLVAGVAGGLLGIGGSIIIIPALTILLGPNQHLYQASSMIVNVVIAASALPRHLRGGAVRRDVVGRMLPAAIAAMLLGVAISDQLAAAALQIVFGVFLVWFGLTEIASLARGTERTDDRPERTGWLTCSLMGATMGFLGGLLGIGGGVVVVPLLRRFARLPLRHCIGSTTAVMLVTATIGATNKNWTLARHPSPVEGSLGSALTVGDSLALAAVLAPAAIVGAFLGSHLNYRMPLRGLRLALVALILLAAARMLGVPALLQTALTSSGS